MRRKLKKLIELIRITHNSHKKNNSIINIWRIKTPNVGDLVCSPSLYFKELQKNAFNIDICDFHSHLKLKNKIIIVGGGGLLQPYFEKNINNIIKLAQNNKIIFWGVGFDNYIGVNKLINIPSNNIILSTRDFPSKHLYIPCPSCLSPLIEKYKNNTRTLGNYALYLHGDYSKQIEDDLMLPCLYNTKAPNFESALKFISSYNIILTNSYHGLYWATLLNKKVIILPWIDKNLHIDFAYKLKNFKYHHPLLKNWKQYQTIKNLCNYPQALEECRKINLDFFHQYIVPILQKSTNKQGGGF